MGESAKISGPENELRDLVEACLADNESGKALNTQQLRASAGDLWEDLQACLEVMRAELAEPEGDEMVDAPSAREVTTAAALSPFRMRVRVVLLIARALETCHAAGVIHRDVKPDNILMPLVDSPKLIDFGLSHLAAQPESLGVTEGLIGTERYLPPEQRRGGRTGASERSDVYSLGVILYELLSLRHPLNSAGPAGARSLATDSVVPLRKIDSTLPAELEWIAESLSKNCSGSTRIRVSGCARGIEQPASGILLRL